MKKAFVLSAVAMASGLLAINASAMDILARVVSSTPVVQQVSVPRQVCTTQPMVVEAPKSGAGAMMGALAGGAMGNAVGNGGGRALATAIGLVGGAIVGNNIEGPNQQVQNVQQCSTQTSYENRTSYYNVVYEYADKQYSIQMTNDPGPYVRLQVTPVGAVPVQADTQQGYVQPSAQPVYAQPVYVQQPPVVVYPGYPGYGYYARPYYPPVGLSLNFGFGGHGHWR
jgi:uncharacterized protein YcfJ